MSGCGDGGDGGGGDGGGDGDGGDGDGGSVGGGVTKTALKTARARAEAPVLQPNSGNSEKSEKLQGVLEKLHARPQNDSSLEASDPAKLCLEML